MKIESITYEEKYVDLKNPSIVKTVDKYLIKSSGEIIRILDGETVLYNDATSKDFNKLEKDLAKFIDIADHTVYFIDNTIVSIIVNYKNGTKQILERGLSHGDEFLDALIEDYIDEYTE